MTVKTNRLKFQLISVFLLFGLLFQLAGPVLACGPFVAEPLFSFTRHADYPLVEYNAGNVGIVPDSFGRMSLFVFYRYLSDAPLTKEEQKQVAEAMKTRIGNHWGNARSSQPDSAVEKPDYLEQWKKARAKVLGGETNVSPDKASDEDYSYIYNCLPDSFRTAAKTLEDRLAKYGADANVKEWVNGQDAVFANCDQQSKMPESLPESYPEWLRKDRQYQIAAALFYQDKMPQARAAFEQIAADNNSVWNKTAKFVVARTFIRQASFINDQSDDYEEAPVAPVSNTNVVTSNVVVANTNAVSNSNIKIEPPRKIIKTVDEKKREKTGLLQKAESGLRNILQDSATSEFHDSARRLLNLVVYRANPVQRKKDLAKILAQPSENRNIYNDLTDYIWLLDNVDGEARDRGIEREQKEAEQSGNRQNYDYDYRLKLRDLPASEREEELTEWLFAYQSADSFNHAYEKWKATRKNLWLITALAKADAKRPQSEELLKAADSISSAAPAFAAARYHQIRLLLETGKRAEAKRKLDEIFSGIWKKFNISTQNKFLAQRTAVSENLDEFLRDAQRRPAVFTWSDDANEEGINTEIKQIFDETDYSFDKKMLPWTKQTMFDEDAVAFFNEKMPLSVLKQAAVSPQLPDHLKKFVVVAGWTRSFILKNQAMEREFTSLMQKHATDLNPLFSQYAASAPNTANREAAALITVLRYPVMQPFVPVAYGREITEPTIIDSIRGNWWCVKSEDENYPVYYDRYQFNFPAVYPNFLTPAQTAEAEREQRQLKASGNSATNLTRRAVEFAIANPNHPQTPEILHLAVRSTRYGCKDAETGNFSKQAFQILHKRYPNSDWTKKTPYWFS